MAVHPVKQVDFSLWFVHLEPRIFQPSSDDVKIYLRGSYYSFGQPVLFDK
jgi:hypothetical protein